jgi:hypothetical protein
VRFVYVLQSRTGHGVHCLLAFGDGTGWLDLSSGFQLLRAI